MLLVLLALVSTVNGGQIIPGRENVFNSKPANARKMMSNSIRRYQNTLQVIERRAKAQKKNVPQVVMVNPEIKYFVKINKNQRIEPKNTKRHQYDMQAQEPKRRDRQFAHESNSMGEDVSGVRSENLSRGPMRNPMRRNKKVATEIPHMESFRNPTRERTEEADDSPQTSTKRPKKSKTSSTRETGSRSRSRNSGTTSPSPVISSTSGTGKVVYDVWIVFKRREYMVKRNAKSFDDAEESCKKLGAHLVSIHSEEENNFIHKITSTGSKIESFDEFVYIGLRLNSKNEWEWVDESGYNYKNWGEHQPDLPDREKCAQFHQGPANLAYVKEYQWNSIPCDFKMKYYVCKRSFQQK